MLLKQASPSVSMAGPMHPEDLKESSESRSPNLGAGTKGPSRAEERGNKEKSTVTESKRNKAEFNLVCPHMKNGSSSYVEL